MSRPGVHGFFLAASNGLVKNMLEYVIEDFGIRNPPRTQFRRKEFIQGFPTKNMYSIPSGDCYWEELQ